LLGIALIEHMEKACLVKTVFIYTRVALLFYIMIVLVRSFLYFEVIKKI